MVNPLKKSNVLSRVGKTCPVSYLSTSQMKTVDPKIKTKIEKAIKSSDEKLRLIYTIGKTGFKNLSANAPGMGPQDMTAKNFEAYLYMLNTYGQNLKVSVSGRISDFTMSFHVDMHKHLLTSKKVTKKKVTKVPAEELDMFAKHGVKTIQKGSKTIKLVKSKKK